MGDRVTLEAFALLAGYPSGYQFQVIGEAEADLFELMGQMVARMRRSLGQQHLTVELGFGLVIADWEVRAQITSDANEAFGVPVLIIDGQEISWEEFGRMILGFEGWQFKLEIRDRCEEV